jgi:hypothetical protein
MQHRRRDREDSGGRSGYGGYDNPGYRSSRVYGTHCDSCPSCSHALPSCTVRSCIHSFLISSFPDRRGGEHSTELIEASFQIIQPCCQEDPFWIRTPYQFLTTPGIRPAQKCTGWLRIAVRGPMIAGQDDSEHTIGRIIAFLTSE